MSNILSKTRRKVWREILTFLDQSKELRHSTEVAKEVKLANDSAYYRLKSLAVEGLVQMQRTPYNVILWQITEKGREWLKEP